MNFKIASHLLNVFVILSSGWFRAGRCFCYGSSCE